MSLDLAVSRAVMKLRLMEHALHGNASWEMRFANTTAKANKTVFDDRVVFSATFLKKGWNLSHETNLELLYGKQVVSVRRCTLPDYEPFIVDWAVAIDDAQIAA